jgi:DNA-binding transcriptional MerR regulator
VTDDDQQYSLSELTEAAGVSPRTVRYYIGEGLLPPPVAHGPRSYYTSDHLVRLKAIGKLKDAYLPLREVRRRLNQFSDDQLTFIASSKRQVPPGVDEVFATLAPDAESQPLDSASEYIARALYQPSPAIEETDQPAPSAPLQMGKLDFHAYAPVEKTEAAPEEESTWRRIQLGDEAELLIREEAYQRNHDRVEWLIDWAKKVFR